MTEEVKNIPLSNRIASFFNRCFWTITWLGIVIALGICLFDSHKDLAVRASNCLKILWGTVLGATLFWALLRFLFSPLFAVKFDLEKIKSFFGLNVVVASIITFILICIYPISFGYYFLHRKEIKDANFSIIEKYYIGQPENIYSEKYDKGWNNDELNRYPITLSEARDRFLAPLCLPNKKNLFFDASSKDIIISEHSVSPVDVQLKIVPNSQIIISNFVTVNDKSLVEISTLNYLEGSWRKYEAVSDKAKEDIAKFLKDNNKISVNAKDLGRKPYGVSDDVYSIDISKKYYCPHEKFFYAKRWFYKDSFGEFTKPVILRIENIGTDNLLERFELNNKGEILWK